MARSDIVPFTRWDAFWLHILVWLIILYMIGALVALFWPAMRQFWKTLIVYTTSLGPGVPLPGGTSRYTRAAKIARVYYMTLYGGRYLPLAVRRVLQLAVLLLGALVLRFVVVEYLNRYARSSSPYYMGWMLGLFILVEAGLWWRDRQLALKTGKNTLAEQRLRVVRRLFKTPDGPSRFRARVERTCGAESEPPAPALAPFWPESRIRVSFGAVITSLVGGVLVEGLLIRAIPDNHAWDSLNGYASVFVGASMSVLLVQVTVVYCLLVLGAFSSWPAIYLGRRYFPLQVLLWDLRDPDQS